MQMVYLIEEDNHGQIGIAKDYPSAIDFLVNSDWLDENFEIYNDGFCHCKSIKDDLGEKWKEKILSWDTETFNNYFEGCLYLTIEGIYGT